MTSFEQFSASLSNGLGCLFAPFGLLAVFLFGIWLFGQGPASFVLKVGIIGGLVGFICLLTWLLFDVILSDTAKKKAEARDADEASRRNYDMKHPDLRL